MLSAFEISADQTSELHQRTRGHAAGRDRADSLMDPLSYFVTPILADVGRSGANVINERADNMALYDDVEDTSLDLYAAVRNGYLQRRREAIVDAICDRDRTWQFISQRSELQHEYSCAIEQ
jgi:ABC-type transporter lipoprotein component MlaA